MLQTRHCFNIESLIHHERKVDHATKTDVPGRDTASTYSRSGGCFYGEADSETSPSLDVTGRRDAHKAHRHELGFGHAMADCSGIPDVSLLIPGCGWHQCSRCTAWNRLELISAASRNRYDERCCSPGQYRV